MFRRWRTASVRGDVTELLERERHPDRTPQKYFGFDRTVDLSASVGTLFLPERCVDEWTMEPDYGNDPFDYHCFARHWRASDLALQRRVGLLPIRRLGLAPSTFDRARSHGQSIAVLAN